MITRRYCIAVFACALAFVACADNSPQPAIRITNAWSNPTPPGISVGAAFMTFAASQSDRLLSATSPIAENVELHTMSMEDGVMQMRPLQTLELPAGKTVSLEPGGIHFMLLGLKQPLVAKGSFLLKLRFAHAGEQWVTVHVRERPSSQHSHH